MPLYEGYGCGTEKTAVVLEIGHYYTKVGFAGENGPRAIIRSEILRSKTNDLCSIFYGNDTEDKLYPVLLDFLHMIYFTHLLVNPKERRLVVIEPMLGSTIFRNVLAKVMFNHYEVPSIAFVPSHLVSVFTLGIPSCMVMDVGYEETVVIPVYENTAILKSWQAIPVAGRAIHENLRTKLCENAVVKYAGGLEKPLSSLPVELTDKELEDIKVRCCFVTNKTRADHYNGISEIENFKPPPDVHYPLNGNSIIQIPGKIRELCHEILFEKHMDEKSIATLILDSVMSCPIDIRKTMAENVLVMGGTAMTAGFMHRLQTEVHKLLSLPEYNEILKFDKFLFHKPPALLNCVTWLGGAIFGALEVLPSRSINKESFQIANTIPDWASLVDNDEKEDKLLLPSKKFTPTLPVS